MEVQVNSGMHQIWIYIKHWGGTRDLLRDGIEDLSGPIDYLYAENAITMTINSFVTPNCLFDINGKLHIQTKTMKCENTYFLLVGNLIFESIDQDCPIHKIKITACNNTKPIKINGILQFSKAPKVDLEFINASRIDIKFRPQKQ